MSGGGSSAATPYNVVHIWRWNHYLVQRIALLDEETLILRSDSVDAYIHGVTNLRDFIPEDEIAPVQGWAKCVGSLEKAMFIPHCLT